MKLLSASFLLPIPEPPIRDGAIAIDRGEIVELGPQRSLIKKYPEAEQEEYPGAVLMPGLINADTQLEFSSLPGAGRDLSPTDWFLARLEHQQQLTLTERRDNVTDGLKRLLRCGTTCAGDVGQYTGLLPILIESPIRLILFSEILTSAQADVSDRYQASLNLVDEILARRSPNVSAGLAPFSAYTLSRPLLKIIAQQARQWKIPVKIHLSETFAEMQFFYESSGEIAEKLFPKLGWVEGLPPPHRKTPVEFLDSIGFLDNGPILIGGLHLSEADFAKIAKGRCKIVWRPRVQKSLKLGDLPLAKIKRAKIPIGLGSDGSPESLSLWDEMRSVEGKVSAEELLKLATLGGAQVLGLDATLGSLEAGKTADLIAVKVPASLKPSQLAEHLVEKTTDREILAVYVAGQKI